MARRTAARPEDPVMADRHANGEHRSCMCPSDGQYMRPRQADRQEVALGRTNALHLTTAAQIQFAGKDIRIRGQEDAEWGCARGENDSSCGRAS